jgi:predicted GIY-YIG superfamily endonuclease
VFELPDEASARREEARIKRLTREEKLELVRRA